MLILPQFSARWLWSFGFLMGFVGTLLADEQFLLQVPGRNDLTSSATVNRQQLAITDSQNQTFLYQREPQLDTADGRFWGFYSQAAGQAIRWPANNAGSMLIGGANGQNWRQSRQQIHALPAAAAPQPPQNVETRRPVLDSPTPNAPVAQGNQAGPNYPHPVEVAYADAGNQALDVGYIGPQGDLQLYRGFGDQWQSQPMANRPLNDDAGLLPGAPLRLVSRKSQELPSAYTVNSGGKLIEIRNGNQIHPLADDLQFAPRSHLSVQATERGAEGFAVDAQGRLWNLDLAGGQHQLIDPTAGRFTAGAPVSLVSQQFGPRRQEDLYLVDRQGQIVNYSTDRGRWNGPQNVAAGFPAGAPLAAASLPLNGRNQIRLAGVDVRGQIQTLEPKAGGWQVLPVQNVTLPPGSPLAFTQAGGNLSLSGIGPGGVWNNWGYAGGNWNPSVVNRGFLSGAPVVADPFSQTAFSVDATGRLVAGGFRNNAWQSNLLLPGLNYAPQLVQRTVAPAQARRPATIHFDNPTSDELVVQMVSPLGLPGREQFNIPPGGSVPESIPRIGGGTLQETFLVPGPLGSVVPRVTSYPLPPQPGPTMVVWAKRVTYRYIDPKGISAVPDFDIKTHASLGVFSLPPGAYLRDGDHFNVFA